MTADILQYSILIATLVLMMVLLIVLARFNNKSQMHFIFISVISLLTIWNVGAGLDKWFYDKGYRTMVFVWLLFTGTCFVPVMVLLMGKIFAITKIVFTYKYLFLFFIPMLSLIVLLTNEYHQLFYIKYSYISSEAVFGKYFVIHSVYSYACITIGIYYLLKVTIKSTGFFSKQSILILVGISVPIILTVLFTLKILTMNQLVTPISFAFAIVCFFIAIFKYDFLGVLPIALEIVIDRISNGFAVIDMDFCIVDFNKAMLDTFKGVFSFKRKDNILRLLEGSKEIDVSKFRGYIQQVHETGKSLTFEHHFISKGNFDEFFSIEITPIIHNGKRLGTIIMLTNITGHKENLRIIREQQQQITEKERLSSLGALIGGISHNLKTPIMSISGSMTALEELSKEYRDSIGNPIVNEDDHCEIANEMLENIDDVKGYLSYINNALTAIKNQVINRDSNNKVSFTLEEAIQSIEFLMKYEVKSNFCNLIIDNKVEKDYIVHGDTGTLVQVINNLIQNSVQAYDKISDEGNYDVSKRRIEVEITKNDNYIVFKVKDYAKGISKSVREKLFKEMTTTKGKEGSGIGLYLSYSKVRGMLGGDMWFESKEGIGTSFYVKIKAK